VSASRCGLALTPPFRASHVPAVSVVQSAGAGGLRSIGVPADAGPQPSSHRGAVGASERVTPRQGGRGVASSPVAAVTTGVSVSPVASRRRAVNVSEPDAVPGLGPTSPSRGERRLCLRLSSVCGRFRSCCSHARVLRRVCLCSCSACRGAADAVAPRGCRPVAVLQRAQRRVIGPSGARGTPRTASVVSRVARRGGSLAGVETRLCVRAAIAAVVRTACTPV
jgi:hypothetical protein